MQHFSSEISAPARNAKPSSGGEVDVSIVVPTFRRPALLRRCLEALCAQQFDPSRYEVIVVDNAGCSETRQVVENARRLAQNCHSPQTPSIRYLVESERRGPAAARNCGWRSARGDVVAFTDDDCIPECNWLYEGMAAFAQASASVLGVMGKTTVPLPPQPTDYQHTVAQLGNSHFITANCFYRRDALEAVGGFDERFSAAWREDSDLLFTLLKREDAHLFDYAPAAVVCHPPRSAPWGASLSQQRKSMFNALLFKKHPVQYRKLIQPSPPWRYYRTVLALLGGLLALLRGQKGVAAIFLTLWALATGRFAADRLNHTSRAPSHVLEMLVTSALIPPLSIFWRLVGALKFRVFFL